MEKSNNEEYVDFLFNFFTGYMAMLYYAVVCNITLTRQIGLYIHSADFFIAI
jgi:hypothetical protein